MKFLLWALIGVVVVMWLLRSKKPSAGIGASEPGKPVASGEQVEPMLQCTYCGVHIPSSEAIASPSGAVFCSDEHRLRHAGS